MKSINLNEHKKFLFFSLILISLPLTAFSDIQQTHKNIAFTSGGSNTVSDLVENILKSTEDALSRVEANPRSSLLYVKNAINTIDKLKNELSHDTHVENKSPLIVNGSKEYWFIYPPVNKEVLHNKAKFPTIYAKLKNGIIYQGNNNKQNNIHTAYFDYAFAKASLLTAREALVANNTREAISSLRWVFEAIYMNPDFYITDLNLRDVLIIDKLMNIKDDYPLVSQSNN